MIDYSVDLIPNEEILYSADISQWVTAGGWGILGVGLVFRSPLCFWAGVVLLLILILYRYSTKIFMTSYRVIFKQGLFAWNIEEMDFRYIESIDTQQSLVGRMFNFGTVTITGTGGSTIELDFVDSPRKLSQIILAQQMSYRRR